MRLRLFLFLFLVNGAALIAQKTKYEYSSPELEKAVELYREKQYEASLSAYSEIISNAIGQNDFEKAVFAMEKKGNVLRLRGRNQEAIQLMDSAIVLAKQKLPKDHILLSKVFFRRGVIDYRLNHFYSALEYFDSSSEKYEKASAYDSAFYYRLIEFKFYGYQFSEGNIDSLRKYINELLLLDSIKQRTQHNPGAHLQLMRSHSEIFNQSGDYDRAFVGLLKAYLYAKKYPEEISNDNLGDLIFSLTKVIFFRRDYKHTLDIIDDFYDEIKQPQNYVFFEELEQLKGVAYLGLDKFEDAAKLLIRASKSSIYNEDGVIRPVALIFNASMKTNIAICYENLKKDSLAQFYYNQATDELRSMLEYPNPNFQELYHIYGKYLLKRQNWEKGLIILDSALRNGVPQYTSSMLSFPSLTDKTLSNLDLKCLNAKTIALSFYALTQEDPIPFLKATEAYADHTHRLIAENKEKYLEAADKIFLSKMFKELYSAGTSSSLELYRTTKDEKYIDRALTHMSRGKAQLFLEQMGDQQAIRGRNVALETKKEFLIACQKADSLDAIANTMMDVNPLDEKLMPILEEQIKWKDRIKQIKKSIASLAPVQEEDISVGGIRKRFGLSGKKAFVEFLDADSVLYAVAVSEKGTAFEKIKKDSLFNNALDSMLAMASSQQGPVPKKFAKTAAYLYQRLLAGLEDQLGGFEAITVVPDEKLALLPFGLLAKSSTGKEQSFKEVDFLLKRASVNHLFSSMANFQDEGQKEGKGILGFGYVGEGITDERATMGGLPGAMKEIEFLSSRFRGSYFMGNSGTKQKFLKEAGQYDIIHLAIHGRSDPSDRFRSSLVFNGEDDYNLTASDLYSTDLRSKLAVLSACETGIGKVSEGEGTFSIARGFAIAGVPAIVTTLWKVNDISGSKISRLFYGNLEKGMDKAEALRQAKIQYLSEADNLTESPFYWGNYILIGDPEPIVLKKKAAVIWKWPLALLFVCIAAGFIVQKRKRVAKF